MHESKILLSNINNLAKQGNFRQASQLCQHLNTNYPDNAEGWHIASRLAQVLNNKLLAIDYINRAIYLAPNEIDWKLYKIQCLINYSQKHEAINEATILANSNFNNAVICEQLAQIFISCHHYVKAKELYEKAVQITPNCDQNHYNLASVLQYLGKINDAIKSCDNAISINKHHYDAYFLRSSLIKASISKNHIKELFRLKNEKNASPIDSAKISFSLAKELEDTKDYQASFDIRKQGADIYRQQMNYDVKDDINFINKIIDVFNEEQFNNLEPSLNNNEAIFILGLPRTGTTLLERIISGHSDVYSAGELTNFPRILSGMIEKLEASSNSTRTDLVEVSSKINFAQLGQSYIDSTRPETALKPRFIDKFPQNALYAGLIHKALPKAKIILLERHPLDVCYSVYKQLFTDIYQFSYNLDELAEYFIAHQRLMQHWQKVIPGAIKVVRYESLIQNIEQVTKDLFNYCDLDWQPDCLEFQNNKQVSTTASASQVRRKLYSSSISMWRNYEEQLTPLKIKLENAGCLEGWPT